MRASIAWRGLVCCGLIEAFTFSCVSCPRRHDDRAPKIDVIQQAQPDPSVPAREQRYGEHSRPATSGSSAPAPR